MQAQVTWQGWRGPSGRFQSAAPEAAAATLYRLSSELLRLTTEEAPQSAPGSQGPGRSPGGLRRGLTVQTRWGGSAGSLAVESTAPYTPYVERGRGPIVARPGRLLHFYVGGHSVFARRVRGVAANPFLARAAGRFEPVAAGALRQLVGQLSALLLAD
jgi:hypothetical protein